MTDSTFFCIDDNEPEPNRLTVDVCGLGTVHLNVTDKGLIIDVYPMHVVDAPIHTASLFNEDFADD